MPGVEFAPARQDWSAVRRLGAPGLILGDQAEDQPPLSADKVLELTASIADRRQHLRARET